VPPLGQSEHRLGVSYRVKDRVSHPTARRSPLAPPVFVISLMDDSIGLRSAAISGERAKLPLGFYSVSTRRLLRMIARIDFGTSSWGQTWQSAARNLRLFAASSMMRSEN
jgi:hypothetical protein